MNKLQCPYCRRNVEFDYEDLLDDNLKCPHCRHNVELTVDNLNYPAEPGDVDEFKEHEDFAQDNIPDHDLGDEF